MYEGQESWLYHLLILFVNLGKQKLDSERTTLYCNASVRKPATNRNRLDLKSHFDRWWKSVHKSVLPSCRVPVSWASWRRAATRKWSRAWWLWLPGTQRILVRVPQWRLLGYPSQTGAPYNPARKIWRIQPRSSSMSWLLMSRVHP